MIVTLAVPTLRRYDLLAQLLVPSCERNTRPPDRYYIVDNGGTLDPAAYGLPTEKTTVYRPGGNIGVAAAWNHVHRTVEEYVIMSCDDMEIGPGTIAALVDAAEANPEVDFFFPSQNAHTMFGVYLQRKRLIEKIGPYDERFWPAYFEDNDYCYRMRLAGIKDMSVAADGCHVGHVGSATLKTFSEDEMRQHHERFDGLRTYYTFKWGGPPGHEQWKVPFNGRPPP